MPRSNLGEKPAQQKILKAAGKAERAMKQKKKKTDVRPTQTAKCDPIDGDLVGLFPFTNFVFMTPVSPRKILVKQDADDIEDLSCDESNGESAKEKAGCSSELHQRLHSW